MSMATSLARPVVESASQFSLQPCRKQTPTPEKDPIAVSIDGQERYLAWEIDWDLPEGFTLSQTETMEIPSKPGGIANAGWLWCRHTPLQAKGAYYLYHETTGTFFPFVLLNYNGAYTCFTDGAVFRRLHRNAAVPARADGAGMANSTDAAGGAISYLCCAGKRIGRFLLL